MTSTSPFFSIVVPVYNVEEYVAECLDSILAQRDADFELLVVDDGSPDGSKAVVERYVQNDSRVRLIEQPNQGVAVARNNGVSQAKGRYIVHVDADDVVHPQMLEICRYYINSCQADAVCFDYQRIAPHAGMPVHTYQPEALRHYVTHEPLPLLKQRHRFRISVMAVMTCCRVELARRYPFLSGIKYDDYPYVSALMNSVGCCVSLRAPLYGYTERPGSVMTENYAASNILHHQRALLYIADSYAETPQKLALIISIVYPEILKQIGNAIFRAPVEEEQRLDMLRAFRSLLLVLKDRGCLTRRGHKLRRWYAYSKLLRTDEAALSAIIPRMAAVFH